MKLKTLKEMIERIDYLDLDKNVFIEVYVDGEFKDIAFSLIKDEDNQEFIIKGLSMY